MFRSPRSFLMLICGSLLAYDAWTQIERPETKEPVEATAPALAENPAELVAIVVPSPSILGDDEPIAAPCASDTSESARPQVKRSRKAQRDTDKDRECRTPRSVRS